MRPPRFRVRTLMLIVLIMAILAFAIRSPKGPVTKIAVNPGLVGVSLALREEIVRQLSCQTQVPAGRLEYFRWTGQHGMAVRGWRGSIRSITPIGNRWRVQVHVSPHLGSLKGGIPFTPDYYLETYEYSPLDLTFVSGQAGKGPHLLVVD
jgi:hypothetical protein